MAVARQPWEYVLHRNACMTLGISTHVVDLLTPDILLVLRLVFLSVAGENYFQIW